MPLTPELARSGRAKGAGRKRAAFWRALGFPNCALARAAYKKMREEKKAALERERPKSF